LKVKIECDSSLLQYSLEYFLKDYLDEKGIVITDNFEKDGIVIGKDIKKPFTKASLLLQLENLLNIKKTKNEVKNDEKSNFEQQLESILNECKNKIIKLIKEQYGKE
jgi:hypothetical protein